jgi:polar amino acid transport system ATP-binding protein
LSGYWSVALPSHVDSNPLATSTGDAGATQPDVMISFHDVSKSWGDNKVLRSLNFDVKPGEKVSIIGPSGSGKTTILRVLMTLETPDDGVVTVNGATLWDARGPKPPKETRQMRATRSHVGMVFQQFNLFPHMTALENVVEAPIRVLRMDKEEARERGKSLLEMVGLSSHLNHKPLQLSGGQQQRVAIARALAMRPKVLLFDEPTSALDPELIGEVLNVIRDLAHSTDMTMLMVTHEMRFAEEISDRVVMFDHGAVVEQGPPHEIFTNPTEERTRKFLHAVLDR